jgi:hypothetical protein
LRSLDWLFRSPALMLSQYFSYRWSRAVLLVALLVELPCRSARAVPPSPPETGLLFLRLCGFGELRDLRSAEVLLLLFDLLGCPTAGFPLMRVALGRKKPRMWFIVTPRHNNQNKQKRKVI